MKLNFGFYFLLIVSCSIILSCTLGQEKIIPTCKSDLDSIVWNSLKEIEVKDDYSTVYKKELLHKSKQIRNDHNFDRLCPETKAFTYQKLAFSYLVNKFNYTSLSYIDTCLAYHNEYPNLNHRNYIYALSIKGRALAQQEQTSKSREYFIEALELGEKANIHTDTMTLFRFLFGRTYYDEDPYLAKKYAEEVLRSHSPSDRRIWHYHQSYGALLITHFGEKEMSKHHLELAMEGFLKKEGKTDNYFLAKIGCMNIGLWELPYEQTKMRLEAMERELLDSENGARSFQLDAIYNNLGYLNLQYGNKKESRKNYQKLLAYSKSSNDSNYKKIEGRAYEGLGDVFLYEKNYSEAINYYHRAIGAILGGDTNTNIYQNGHPKDLRLSFLGEYLRILGFKQDAFYKKYQADNKLDDLINAFQGYEVLDEIALLIRMSLSTLTAKYKFLESTVSQYEETINMGLYLYKRTSDITFLKQAYLLASKRKAVLLLDDIQEDKAMKASLPQGVIHEGNALKVQLDAIEKQIKYDNLGAEHPERVTLENKRIQLLLDSEKLNKRISKNYPKFHQLKFADQTIVNLDSIQSMLAEEQVVIEYFVGNDSIYTFYFTKSESLNVKVVAKPKNFAKLCDSYNISIQSKSQSSEKEMNKASFDLYTLLLEPVLKDLAQLKEIDRLIIIPDDYLLNIPFSAMITDSSYASKEQPRLDMPYLINDYSVSVAYSNKYIFPKRNPMPRSFDKEYLGFGIEYGAESIENMDRLDSSKVDINVRSQMGTLSYAAEEIKESASIFGGSAILNKEATKTKFLEEAGSAQILHVAAHGFIMNDSPQNSGIILYDDGKQKDDHILRASDIYGMDINAESTILSACHTANGKIYKGEGIKSLARAFYSAGCPSVTGSLWRAPDYSTKKIIGDYLRNILDGKPKDVALRDATLQYLDNCEFYDDAHPRFWAHLVSTGSQQPITFKSSWW